MKRIRMKTKNGEIELEALGFTGPSCDEATQFLRRNLGDEISSHLKPTYYVDAESEEEDRIEFKPICG